MANTNMEVTPLTKTKFNQRKYENNRSKNIPSMANEDYLNVVEILNEEVGKTILAKQLEKTKSDTITRSKLTKKLSVYTKRLEGYMNDFVLDQSPKRYKMMEKLQLQINDLEKQRNNTQKQYNNKHKNRNDYFEFRFSITNPPLELRRNVDYGNDLKAITKDFINDFLKLDIKIHSYSLHMDQHSPHVHMLGLMDNLTFNQQMANMYGKSFNFHSLQNDFNNFVRNHELFKKYNLDLEHITRGGANEDYKNLKEYKDYMEFKQNYGELIDYIRSIETMPNYDLICEINDLTLEHNDLIDYLKHEGIYNKDFINGFLDFRKNKKSFDMVALNRKITNIDVREDIKKNNGVGDVMKFIKDNNLTLEQAKDSLVGYQYSRVVTNQKGTHTITKTLSEEDVETLFGEIDR